MMELKALWMALVLYVLAGTLAILGVTLKRFHERTVFGLLIMGLVLHTLAIGLRWYRLDHGPFLTMFEILMSNVWSMLLIFAVAYWRVQSVRASAVVVMPIMFMMMGWLLISNPGEGHLPPTYHTIWLYIHIGFGKVFLGSLLVSVGISGIILLRFTSYGIKYFKDIPNNQHLNELLRFLAISMIFETLMLIVGAIWAQDAWGRYWAWDPLETWAFMTWLTLILTIHIRLAYKVSPSISATMVIIVFVVAFLTFFGVPFISLVAHQGAI
jgi:ABC-type transport system involved in cytochrome c biogenesis permease subunit